jgi:hypothetical protein
MTIIKEFCGTAPSASLGTGSAVPFPNELHSEFFSSLLKPS